MLLRYILGIFLLIHYENTWAKELHTQQELFKNQQEFTGIDSLEISGNSIDVIIQKSLNNKTVISCDKQAKIITDGNRLLVESPRQNFFFSLFSPTCKFCINIPATITDLKVSTGKGRIIIDGTNLNQLKISGGNVEVLLKEMQGHVDIKSGNCKLRYFATNMKRNKNVMLECASGMLDFTAFLSDGFTGFCPLIKCGSFQIKESFLPTTTADRANIVLKGKCGTAKVSIKRANDAD